MKCRWEDLRGMSPDSLGGVQFNLSHAERPELRPLRLSVAPQRSIKMRDISRSINIADNDPLPFGLFL